MLTYHSILSRHSALAENLSLRALTETIKEQYLLMCWSQWPRGLRCRSAAAHLLRGCGFESRMGRGCLSLVSVCVLSDELMTRPDESY